MCIRDRFKIEEVATKNSIPILAIVIKQTIEEAITLMSENIAKHEMSVKNQIYEMSFKLERIISLISDELLIYINPY